MAEPIKGPSFDSAAGEGGEPEMRRTNTLSGLKHNLTMTSDIFSQPGDPFFNVYWVLLLLGIFLTPIPCYIGMIGLGSKKANERAAAKACALGGFFWTILWIVIIVKVADD